MEKSQYDELKKMQEIHWWFKAKKEIVLAFIKKYGKSDGNVLDVGCGMGLMLHDFPPEKIYGIDMEQTAVDYCRENYHGENASDHIKQGSLPENIPFQHKFDTIIALDVLEHIENDKEAVLSLYNILAPGGILVLTVPANMKLWSNDDVMNHHYRRYEKQQLMDLLSENDLEIMRCTYYNSILLLPAYIERLWKKIFKITKTDVESSSSKLLNTFLYRIFRMEKSIILEKDLKKGVSLLAVIKKY